MLAARPRTQAQQNLRIAVLLVIIAWGIGFYLGTDDLEAIRAVVIFSVLTGVSLLLFWRVSRDDPEGSRLLMILFASFALKLVMILFREYGGLFVDAAAYNNIGQGVARRLGRGEWPEELLTTGSAFVRLLVGLFYYTVGVTFGGITILWAWLGLLGMLFFYLAFRTAVPSGDGRLYSLLIFVYPSLLLWTSSLGKDALIIMLLGMATYGVARSQRQLDVAGLWWLALGMGGVVMIRPHVAAVFMIAVAVSVLVRPIRAGLLTPIVRFAGFAVLIGLTALTAGAASNYAGLEDIGPEGVLASIDLRQDESARGGSAFEQVDVATPLGLVMAVPTILFRPFPWEAHNTYALIASLEGLGLLALVLYRRRSIVAAFLSLRQNSYMLFVAVYVLLFIFFFSAIGNFGIIARQRASQLFPFLFICLAYMAPRQSDKVEIRGAPRA